jgi:hypothetical protein
LKQLKVSTIEMDDIVKNIVKRNNCFEKDQIEHNDQREYFDLFIE